MQSGTFLGIPPEEVTGCMTSCSNRMARLLCIVSWRTLKLALQCSCRATSHESPKIWCPAASIHNSIQQIFSFLDLAGIYLQQHSLTSAVALAHAEETPFKYWIQNCRTVQELPGLKLPMSVLQQCIAASRFAQRSRPSRQTPYLP